MQTNTGPALSCCVPGCQSVSLSGQQKWSAVPVNEARVWLWLAAMRKDVYHKSSLSFPQYVCSQHFVSGVSSDDPFNKDYVPTLNLPTFDSDDENAVNGKDEICEADDCDVSCKYVKVYNNVCEECPDVLPASIPSITESEYNKHSSNYKDIRNSEKNPAEISEKCAYLSNKADRNGCDLAPTKASADDSILSKNQGLRTQEIVTIHKNGIATYNTIINIENGVQENTIENSNAKQPVNEKESGEDTLQSQKQHHSQMLARCDISIPSNSGQELLKGIEGNTHNTSCDGMKEENSCTSNETHDRIIKELEDMVTNYWENEEHEMNSSWEKEREKRMRSRWKRAEYAYMLQNGFCHFKQQTTVSVSPPAGLSLKSVHQGTNTTNQGIILGGNVSSIHQGPNVMSTVNGVRITDPFYRRPDHGTSIVSSIYQGTNLGCADPSVRSVYQGNQFKGLHQQLNSLGAQQGLSVMVNPNQHLNPQHGMERNNITRMGLGTAGWNSYRGAVDLSIGANDQYLKNIEQVIDTLRKNVNVNKRNNQPWNDYSPWGDSYNNRTKSDTYFSDQEDESEEIDDTRYNFEDQTRYNIVDNNNEMKKSYETANKDRLNNNFTYNTLTTKENNHRDRFINTDYSSGNTGGFKDMALIADRTNKTQSCSFRNSVSIEDNEPRYDRATEIKYTTRANKDCNTWRTKHTPDTYVDGHLKPTFMDKENRKMNASYSYDDISSYLGDVSQSEFSEDAESKETNSDDYYDDEDEAYTTADEGSDDDVTNSNHNNNNMVTNYWHTYNSEITSLTQGKQKEAMSTTISKHTGTVSLKNSKKHREMPSQTKQKDSKAPTLKKQKHTIAPLQPKCKGIPAISVPQCKMKATSPTKCKKETPPTKCKKETPPAKCKQKETSPLTKCKKETPPIKRKQRETSPTTQCKQKKTAPKTKCEKETPPLTKSKKENSPQTKCKMETSPPTKCKKGNTPSQPQHKVTSNASASSYGREDGPGIYSAPVFSGIGDGLAMDSTTQTARAATQRHTSTSFRDSTTQTVKEASWMQTCTSLRNSATQTAKEATWMKTCTSSKDSTTQTCFSMRDSITQTQINNTTIWTQTFILASESATQTLNAENWMQDSSTQTQNCMSVTDLATQTANIATENSTTQTVIEESVKNNCTCAADSTKTPELETVHTSTTFFWDIECGTIGQRQGDDEGGTQINTATRGQVGWRYAKEEGWEPSPSFYSLDDYRLFTASYPLASSGKENVDIVTLASPTAPVLPSMSLGLGTCPKHSHEVNHWCLECQEWLCSGCLSDHNKSKCVVSPAQEVFVMQRDDIVTQASSLILKLKAQRTQFKNFTIKQNKVMSPQENIRGQNGSKNDSKPLGITEVQEWIEELYDMIAGLFTKKTVWELGKVRDQFMKLEVDAEEGREANERTIEKLIELEATGKKCLLPKPLQNSLSNVSLEALREKLCAVECVFAVVQRTNRVAWSRVTLEDQYLILHNFSDTPPPPHAIVLQFEDVWELSKGCLPKAFMEVGWYGMKQGRVTFSLLSTSRRGLQFLLLCCGVEGPSYQYTLLFWSPMDPNVLHGGEYYTNSMVGQGIIDIGKHEETPPRPLGVGEVFGAQIGDMSRQTQFHVQINPNCNVYCTTTFAKVDCGLPVLTAACHAQNQAYIFNSGIMLKIF